MLATINTSGQLSGSSPVLSSSYALNATSASYAVSASNATNAVTASFANAFTVANTLTAQTLVVQTITSSVDFVTGSTRFGSILGNTHVFSGSVSMNPGGLFISSSGFVGIGLTNPGVALDISGYSRVTGIGLNSTPTSIGANPNYVRLTNTGGDLYLGQEGSTNGGFFVGSFAYDSVLYSGRSINSIINGVSRMYISSSGNVGIGTASPTGTYGKLSVAGGISILDDNNAKLEIGRYSSGIPNSYIKLGANSGKLIVTNAADIADIFTITNSGSVGIGTTTPLSKLHISGSGANTQTLNLQSSANNANAYVVFSSGNKSYITGLSGDISNSYLIYDNTAGVERMRITSGGTVFNKQYVGSTLTGGYSLIGTISAINVADTYAHVKISTVGSMMYWIKVFGYQYIYGLIEGMSGGYIGGGTGAVQQPFQNGSIVAQYQNNGYLEIVIYSLSTATTNRWGSITLFGGTDTIATVQPLEILEYSWTSTTTRVY
jgi:hypothetical protein